MTGGGQGTSGRRRDERGASGLTGAGPSQLGVQGSMRVRDVSRPTDDAVARAERLVQVSFRPRSSPRPPGQPPGRAGSSPDDS